jgi:hypothetical protein
MGFERTDTGRIVLRVGELERTMLRSLAQQVRDLVAPPEPTGPIDPLQAMVGIDPTAQRPEDPALARLLPDAYRGDEEAAAEFRRFTERSLRDTKVAHATAVLEHLERSGEKVVISADEATSWLGFLNDARLALGTRIGITEENHEELATLPDDDPRGASFQVYNWLTYLQDSLLEALMEIDLTEDAPTED